MPKNKTCQGSQRRHPQGSQRRHPQGSQRGSGLQQGSQRNAASGEGCPGSEAGLAAKEAPKPVSGGAKEGGQGSQRRRASCAAQEAPKPASGGAKEGAQGSPREICSEVPETKQFEYRVYSDNGIGFRQNTQMRSAVILRSSSSERHSRDWSCISRREEKL